MIVRFNAKYVNDSITPRQAETVKFVESMCGVKFKGRTRLDVSQFLDKYLDQAIEISNDDRMNLEDDGRLLDEMIWDLEWGKG